MNLSESLNLIKTFYKERNDFGGTNDISKSTTLEKEKGIEFPPEFKNYIDSFIPSSNYHFRCVGNPMEVYSRDKLSWFMDGYNFNSVLNEPINNWKDTWFIFADEGADPVIIKLDEKQSNSVVYKAMHGAGEWSFDPIADSIGQFLLCSAAVDHALGGFGLEDAIVDDENGFKLADQPAEWLFPFIEKYAKNYYDEWVSVFENS
ncbi:SMI1/KNR4 family protein [Shewanella algae]|uniref:SMI1/KNR4 family protein n=1 Tax=Shewanella algae TaxID=38313 RepID=UPI0011AA172D|nr:SMI1/KNR4 family protein [Shewanella algae]TWO82586.1 hypothetical protein AYI75_19850 [Shewanella algae]